jgi:L-ribulose-5-phosphate 3-epimerase
VKLSCVTYSYLAEPVGFSGKIDWPWLNEVILQAPVVETIDRMLERLAPAELDGLEIWLSHVWPANITPVVASQVRQRMARHNMACCALAGSPGNPAEDRYRSEERFETALLLHAPVIAGHVDAKAVQSLGPFCAHYRVHVAYENHPEKDAAEILNVIGGGSEWIGVAFDTGSLAQHDGDPAETILQLREKIIHVHLRDVPMIGSDASVAIGTGIIDFSAVVKALKAIGYDGWLSIEIPTEDHDPTDEIIESAQMMRRLWNQYHKNRSSYTL